MTESATISNTRLCFPAPHQVVLQTEELAKQLEPHQLLIKCLYSLISPGTELAMYTRTHVGFDDPNNTFAKYPFYPGYAAVGRVEATGPEVEGFKKGDVVYYLGHHSAYSIQSYRQSPVLLVPDGLPLECIPFIRLAQISNTALVFSDAKAQDSVAVIGLGVVGHMAAQLFRIRGAKVIAADLLAFRRGLAQEAGIDQLINPQEQDLVSAIKEATAGEGARTVIEATGSPNLISPALEATRKFGEVILLGSPRGKAMIDVYNLIHRQGISLRGAHELLVSRHTDAPEPNQHSVSATMMRYLQTGELRVGHLVSEVVRPNEAEKGFKALLSKQDKTMSVLIDWRDR